MSDESGTFNVRKLRSGSGGIWLPLSLLGIVVGGAITWGSNANRLTQVEQHADRIESHVAATDAQVIATRQQAAVLESRYSDIQEQLREINRKLDDRERR